MRWLRENKKRRHSAEGLRSTAAARLPGAHRVCSDMAATEAAPPATAAPHPQPSIAPNGYRVRRRDGKIVKHSRPVYHIYKHARRALKRERVYYLSNYEDRPLFDPEYADEWVQVRHYQAAWLLKRLQDRDYVSEEVAEKVKGNLETIEAWIFSNRVASKGLNFSSAASWVATLVLHYMASNVSKEWAFESKDFVDRFHPSRLWDIFEDVPESTQRDGVVVLPLDEVQKQHRLEDNFHRLIDRVRNSGMPGICVEDLPEVMTGVASLQPPKRIVIGQFGKQYV
jgi:hypothetical protein